MFSSNARCALLTLAAVGTFLAAPARADESPATWELQLPGLSYHFGSPHQPGKKYREFHDGLGLQRTSVHPNYVVRYTAGFLRDSFNNQGLYAGASISYRFYDEGLKAELGLAPMLLYRTTRFDNDRGNAPLKLIPIIMPMVILDHPSSGFGANITVLPGGNFGKGLNFPGLVFVQLTYRIR
jgi:hypothetical protein